MYISIAGNIGSGKTTLTRMLATHYKWVPRFEPVVDNPYLSDYYKDIKRWTFALEVFFLKERFKDMIALSTAENDTVVDRSIYEGVHVFTAGNHDMGNLSDRDYETYMELFEQMTSVLQMPRLMIYLQASVPHLVKNIQKRGRDYEQSMKIDYLEAINKRYEDFINNKYTGEKLIINVNNLDFEHNPEDFALIVRMIDERLSPKLF